MFGRKNKEQALTNAVDDSKMIAYDFMRRLNRIFESYRCADYRPYHRLCEEEMKPLLDRYLDVLFNGDVDDANGDMLDNIIFGPYREAVPYLNAQRINHKDLNRRLAARRVSDLEDFTRIRNERQKELERLEQEYKQTCNKIIAVEEV